MTSESSGQPPARSTDGPKPAAKGQQRQAERHEKMAEALRANLRRRKEQSRARRDSGEGD